MTKQELRQIVKEEVQKMKLESKKYKVQPRTRIKENRKLNEAIDLSKFDLSFDLQVAKNMDCDDFLPHTAYSAEDKDGNIAQVWLWAEKNGKCNYATSDGDGDDYVEKIYPSLAVGLKVIKKAIRKTEVEMLVKGVKVTM